jgi:TatD DNase family protein
MSNIFDTHCHPQFPQYTQDREEMIRRALGGGVFMICVGTDYETSKQGINLAQKTEGIWASIGLHPNDNLGEKFEAEKYRELLQKEKVVALGEIGLDYYRTEKPEDQKLQKERFVQQLELADEFKKPLILHCRDSKSGSAGRAYPDMIEILKNGHADNGGVIHSYTGNLEEAKKFLDLGLYLGFNGIITFARQYDEVVRYVPLENILLETDAPYLTPEPYRGKRNEPLYVKEVAKKVAELKNLSVEEVITKTTQNVIKLFNINI